MTATKLRLIVIAALVLGLNVSQSANAGYMTNGSFDTTTNGGGQLGYNTNATGWTTSGYNFLFTSGSADTSGVAGQYGNLKLWGPNDGMANGLTVSSPDGGNYVGADGDFQTSAITQTLTGLTAGYTYKVGFWWAAAQQTVSNAPSADQWQVSFGSQTQSTAIVNDTAKGFTGWVYQTFNFTADGSTDVLSFLAVSTPVGVPPFVLLDGISVNVVPEPSTLLLLSLGLLGFGTVVRRRRRSVASA